ncbi:MAG: hypothetical protein NVV74_15455 [Magnetospirillum sp.]|nr:hypothetical protein [Magnetospirillum sp.]
MAAVLGAGNSLDSAARWRRPGADRLGRDVSIAAAWNGPKEVRSAAAEMQDRIRRFVEDRTRMLGSHLRDLPVPSPGCGCAEMLPESAPVCWRT